MAKKPPKYKLRYSPLFYEDVTKIIDYVLLELKNEQAAKMLVDNTEAAIKKRLANPLSSPVYKSLNGRKHAYRRILLGNYLIFYVVIEDTMVVRRMLYGRRDIDRIL